MPAFNVLERQGVQGQADVKDDDKIPPYTVRNMAAGVTVTNENNRVAAGLFKSRAIKKDIDSIIKTLVSSNDFKSISFAVNRAEDCCVAIRKWANLILKTSDISPSQAEEKIEEIRKETNKFKAEFWHGHLKITMPELMKKRVYTGRRIYHDEGIFDAIKDMDLSRFKDGTKNICVFIHYYNDDKFIRDNDNIEDKWILDALSVSSGISDSGDKLSVMHEAKSSEENYTELYIVKSKYFAKFATEKLYPVEEKGYNFS